MSNLLDSLGLSGSIDVYVAMSTSNWLEMAVLDTHTGKIKTYARASVEYNEAVREIADEGALKVKLQKLFEECNLVPSKCNVHFSLPTIWFGFKDNLPLMIEDEAMKNIVLGELEQTFIFKRKDPIPVWFEAPTSLNADSKSIFYTAIQAEIMDSIRTIFKELGANLISFGCSLFADLRGLLTTGIAEAQMNSDENWSLMILNNSGFQLFGLQGKKLLDYYEEPIAIKSYDEDEIYSAIDNAAQIALMSSQSNTLVLISETDMVSSTILAKRLQFNGKLIPIEDNKYKKEPLDNVCDALLPEIQPQVSLHLIGLFADPAIFPMNTNFLLSIEGYSRNDLLDIPIGGGKVISLTKQQAMIYSIIILILAVVPLGVLHLVATGMTQKYNNQIEEVTTEITNIDSQLKNFEDHDGPDFDPYREINRVIQNNRTKIMAFAALGDSIPKNLYLSYFMTGDNGYINIQGCANTVEDVYTFFQNLKDALYDSKLRLSKLDLRNGTIETVIENPSIENAPYVFEITNMSSGQLASFMSSLRMPADNQQDQQQQQPAPPPPAQPAQQQPPQQ